MASLEWDVALGNCSRLDLAWAWNVCTVLLYFWLWLSLGFTVAAHNQDGKGNGSCIMSRRRKESGFWHIA